MDCVLRGRPAVADLGDVAIEAVVELGRAVLPLREARGLRAGDVLSLSKLAGETMTVRLNGEIFAEGETVVHNERKCCRLVRLAPLVAPSGQEAGT